MIISLESGKARIVVNTDKILWDTIQMLDDELAQVKKKHSLFAEYPMEEGEDQDTWYERISPILAEKNKKKKKESNEQYLVRLFKSDMTKQDYVVDALKAIAKTFEGQDSKLDEETLKSLPYVKTKEFIKEVLSLCDIPLGGLS